jgi:hypothetical protein
MPLGFTRQRLGAENVDIGTNYGLGGAGHPRHQRPDRSQADIAVRHCRFSSIGNPNVESPSRSATTSM